MATIDEELARLKFLSGKGRGREKCHVVLIEEEARKRKENSGPRPKTRFVMETDDPEMYSRLQCAEGSLVADRQQERGYRHDVPPVGRG